MSGRDIRDYVEDIVVQISKIEKFVADIDNIEDFRKDEPCCIRAFEIMGEAAKHIPDDIRHRFP